MKKIVAFLIFAAFVGFLGWRPYQGHTLKPDQAKMPEDRSVAVEVEAVRTMTVRDIRTFTGSLRTDSSFVVAPKVGGRLEKVAAHIGEAVRQGQMIIMTTIM